MADELKPADGALPDSVAVSPEPQATVPRAEPKGNDGSLSLVGERRLWALVIALAFAALFLGWRAFVYEEEGDPVASAMLAFEKQNALVVFASRFEVVAESEYEQSIGPVTLRRVRQAAIIPARVDYRLDLSAMEPSDFSWDEAANVLSVALPPIKTSEPNLDEGNVRLFTEGLLNSGGSQQLLSEKNSQIAKQKARKFAQNPEILELARTAAKDAIRQNLAVPLQIAGFDNARVNVRFED